MRYDNNRYQAAGPEAKIHKGSQLKANPVTRPAVKELGLHSGYNEHKKVGIGYQANGEFPS